MPDDDDRPRDASGAANDEWAAATSPDHPWAALVIPDDIRELAPDIAAYHREQRAARRNAWVGRQLARRGALPTCIVLGALMLSALVAGALTVLTPPQPQPPLPAAAVAHPALPSGQVGGLLPDTALRTATGGSVTALQLRPAAVALIPLRCNCTGLLDALAGSADGARLQLAVVAPGPTDAEAAALAGRLHHGTPEIYYDPTGSLAAAVHARGVTLVVLDRDGTINSIQRSVTTASLDLVGRQLESFERGVTG